MMNQTYYHGLCVKSITGDIQEKEKKKLEEWLMISENNKNEYQKLIDVWENSIPQKEPVLPDADVEWVALANRIEREKETVMPVKKINKYKILSIFTQNIRFNPIYAFSTAVVILAFALFFISKQNNPVSQNLIFISQKETRKIQLSDGSTVLLNSLSRLECIKPFNDNVREIKLQGEAYFSVVHEKRPFIITTDNARITVLGTKFDVKASDEKTSVVVREGHVKLSQNRDNGKDVDLFKSQKSVVLKDLEPRSPVTVDSDYLLEWMNGKFVFDRTSLSEIVIDLQRYYKVRINFSDEKIKPLTLTGVFNKDNLENILSAICIANGLNYKKVNEGYLIIKDS